MSGLAVRYLDDHGLLVTADAAWAWWRLGLDHYELLSESQRIGRLSVVASALAGVRDANCHLISVPRVLDPDGWAAALAAATPTPAPGWAPYLERQRNHVGRLGLVRREVYLGVRLAERTRRRLDGWRRRVEEAAGLTDVRPGGEELAGYQTRAESIGRVIAAGLPGRPATAGELAWLIQRSFWRGLPEPVSPPARPAWGGELLALAEGTVLNGRRALRLEQTAGTVPMTTLAMARFPDRLPFPGSEWLYLVDGFPFPVEASVRFKVVPPRQAAGDAARKLADATDQARHIAGTSSDLPLALAESLDRARELEYALTKDPAPLVYTWPRIIVAAPDDAQLEIRATEITEAYRDAGIELVRPSGDQLALFREAIPGESLRLKAYEQRQALATLAGSMFVATNELGDGTGPYIGVTNGRTRAPVHFDPLAAAARNRPTAISLTGAPGAGKTTTARLLMYQLALRGTWVTYIDPKGERGGLADLDGLPEVRTLTLGPEHAGLLNPFALGDTPAEATPVAASACELLMPGRLHYEQRAALLQAVSQEANRVGEPSLHGVAQHLAAAGTEVGRSLAHTLSVCAELPLARLCFPTKTGGPALRSEGVNVLRIDGLRVPDPTSAPDDWTLDQRLGVSVLYLLARFLLRIFEHTDPTQPKAVFLDEAWVLTSTAQGRSLIPALARMGRSRNVAVALLSQNAGDLLGPEVCNNIETKFCFRAGDEREITDVLRLLNVADTPAHRRLVRSLDVGECLYADLDGRVGTVRVDLMDQALRDAFDTTPTRYRPPQELSA